MLIGRQIITRKSTIGIAMRPLTILITACFLSIFALSTITVAEPLGQLETVKAKTFDKEKITFPEDLTGGDKYLLFLAMGADRDNGEAQMNQLLDWQKAIDEKGGLPVGVVAYHFPVMESPPFFVKGLIRGAMADSYEGIVPNDKSGVLFVDKLPTFASKAGLTLDTEPTIIVVDGSGNVLSELKGGVSEEALTKLFAILGN
jgi:hypothetical protein